MYTNSQEELDQRVHELLELKRQAEVLDKEIKSIESGLKSQMEETGVYLLQGEDWTITWNMVTSKRFDQTVFRAKNPDLFSQYQTLSESRRFLLREEVKVEEENN